MKKKRQKVRGFTEEGQKLKKTWIRDETGDGDDEALSMHRVDASISI